MADKFITFIGNRPENVSKAAKYSVRYEKGEYVIGVQYQASDDETWYPPQVMNTLILWRRLTRSNSILTAHRAGPFTLTSTNRC